MTDAAGSTRIALVGAVFVPIADQERALAFYLDTLGFETRADFVYGGGSRWNEVVPPGSPNTIALVPPSEGRSTGGDETHCAFATEDIEADHAALRARGVDVDAAIARARGRHGRGSSRPGPRSRIPCPPSSSSATPTGTASSSSSRAECRGSLASGVHVHVHDVFLPGDLDAPAPA